MTTATDMIDEASFKLRELARPMWADTRSYSLAMAARKIGLSPSQARRIVYRELKRIDAHVLENIRTAYARFEAKAERMADDMERSARARRARIGESDADHQEHRQSVSVVGSRLEARPGGTDDEAGQRD